AYAVPPLSRTRARGSLGITTWRTAAAGPALRRDSDGVDLELRAAARQRRHGHRRAGRQRPGEVLGVDAVDSREVVDVGQEDRRLYHPVQRGAGRLHDRLDVLEDPPGLGGGIAV